MPNGLKAKNRTAGSSRQRIPTAKRVSLGDVAQHSGVSTATVSRVINNSEKVARKSRIAVNASIEELGYIPDGAAWTTRYSRRACKAYSAG